MIPILKDKEIEKMRRAGKALSKLFNDITPLIRPGISTLEINTQVEKIIASIGATDRKSVV